MSKEVQVGTAIIIIRGGKMIIGKRKGSHAAGVYAFPGGHMEFGESIEDCVMRETREECGVEMKVRVRKFGLNDYLFVTNDIMTPYLKHYITIFVAADCLEGEPINAEPHKNEKWEWLSLDDLLTLAKNGECAEWLPVKHLMQYRDELGI